MGLERAHRLDAEVPRPAEAVEAEPPERELPGKRTQVEQMLEQLEYSVPLSRNAQISGAPGRRTLVDNVPATRLDFEDHRVLGLRELLRRLDSDPVLRQAALAAADRTVARRALPAAQVPPREAPSPNGRAMWRAAERHAATLYRRAVDSGEVENDSPEVEAALQRCGSGRPLPASVRRAMEAELGVPLDRVRIHADHVAAEAARAVHAEAFTVGEDIFFADGAYAPEERAGKRLLVHELTHVVQAWQGRTGSDGRVSQAGDPLEREADAVADRIARSEPPAAHVEPAAVTPRPVLVQPAGAQPVLRRAAAGGAPARRSTMPALKGGAKSPQDNPPAQQTMQGTSTEFARSAGSAASTATGKLKHEIADAKTKSPGQRAREQSRAGQRAAQAEERTLRSAEKQHHDDADAHARHTPEDGEHAPTTPAAQGPADKRSTIKFKPISDWSKYMPAPLPDQDERERKRIEELVKAKIEGERNHAGLALEGLRAAHLQQARDVRAMKPKLQAQVATAQQQALAHVAAAESSQAAAVRSHIASVQGQVRSHAGAMKARVNSAHAAAVGQINTTYDAGVKQLTEQRTKAQSKVEASEMLAVLACQLDFLALQGKYSSLGSKKAGDALQVGEDEAGKLSDKWKGEKLEAAQKAARDTADGFATSMPEQAAAKWAEIAAQQAPAEQSLHDFAGATKTNLGLVFDRSKQALDAAKAQSIQAADAARNASIAQIDQACASTVASLAAQGASQVAAIRQQGQAARAGITKAGNAARVSVAQACDQATGGIEGGITGIIRGATQVEAPDPDEIQQQVKRGAQDLERGAGGVAKGLTASATASADGMNQQASGASEGMAAITAALRMSANQAAAAAKQQMTAAASGTQQALTQIAASHKTQTDAASVASQTAFTEQVTTLDGGYKTTAETRGKQFKDGYDDFKRGLDGTVPPVGSSGGAGSGKKEEGGGEGGGGPTGEVTAIHDAAQKAADAVKPWWQKALAVVVSIVVAVVVTIAVVALIAATGPVGMVLVGALAGALSTFAASVASNLVLGNSPLEGITWQSIAIGALGGAISGGITAGIGAAAKGGVGAAKALGGANTAGGALKGAAGLRAAAIRNGTELVTDLVSEQAANLIINQKLDISVENLVLSAVTTVAMGGSKFEGFQNKVQAGLQRPIPGGVKVPGLQIQIGVPKAPAAAGPAGGAPDGAGASGQASAGSRGGTPPANGSQSPPSPRGVPSAPTPAPASTAAPAPTAAPAATPAPGPAGNGDRPPPRPADDAAPSARPSDNNGPATRPSNDNGPSRPADNHPPSQSAHHDDSPTRPADPADPASRPSDDAGNPGDAGPTTAPHADGPTARPDADGREPHTDADGDGKPDATDPDKAPADADSKQPDAADPDAHADGDAPVPATRPDADGGSPEAAAAEAQAVARDGELGELGYAAGTRAKGEDAAGRVEAGDVPPPDTLRDTAANVRGRRELEQLRADPSLTPEQKAKLQRDLAAEMRAHPEPTGDLPRDIQGARARAQNAGDPRLPPRADRGDSPTQNPADPGPRQDPADNGPGRDAEGGLADPADLRRALPSDLADSLPIVVDPSLGPGSTTVRVEYRIEDGVLADIQLRVGDGVGQRNIAEHVNTVRTMRRYQGFSGRVRVLMERVRAWFSAHPGAPIGSRAWEARLEVEKLPPIIEARARELADPETPAARREELDRELTSLESQLAQHQETLEAMSADPGRGFVAAEGTSGAPDERTPGERARDDWQEALNQNYAGQYDLDAWVDRYENKKLVYDFKNNRWVRPDGQAYVAQKFDGWKSEDIFDHLAGNDSSSSFKAYAEMLESEGIAPRDDVIKQIDVLRQLGKGEDEDMVRHALKKHYEAEVLGKMTDPPTKAGQHAAMRRITQNLNSSDKGNLTEEWYRRTFLGEEEGVATHVKVPKEALAQLGSQEDKDRFIDLLRGSAEAGIAHEVKSGEGALSKQGHGQLKDYALMLANNLKVQGQKITELRYTFTSSAGAEANFGVMTEVFADDDVGYAVTFEVFDAQGNRKQIRTAAALEEYAKQQGWKEAPADD